MTLLFVILIILASAILGAIVLIQNPKGGGLAGSFGGFSNQFMGVKQTTDVLEKGTWIFAAVIAVLCITATVFIGDGAGNTIRNVGPAPVNTAPPGAAPFQQGTAPQQQQPTTPDTNR